MTIAFVTWHVALHFMSIGDWCTRVKVGIFDCTKSVPLPGPIMRHVTQPTMSRLIRHGLECSYRRGWYCTPSQIH